MEDEQIEIFDEKEFAKQWQKNGMGNESMWSFFSTSYGQIIDTILRPMAEAGRPGRLLYDPTQDLGTVEIDVWPSVEGVDFTPIKAVRQDLTMTCYGGKKVVFSIWRYESLHFTRYMSNNKKSGARERKFLPPPCFPFQGL